MIADNGIEDCNVDANILTLALESFGSDGPFVGCTESTPTTSQTTTATTTATTTVTTTATSSQTTSPTTTPTTTIIDGTFKCYSVLGNGYLGPGQQGGSFRVTMIIYWQSLCTLSAYVVHTLFFFWFFFVPPHASLSPAYIKRTADVHTHTRARTHMHTKQALPARTWWTAFSQS